MKFFRVDEKYLDYISYEDMHKNSGDFGIGVYFTEVREPGDFDSLVRKANLDIEHETKFYDINIEEIIKSEKLKVLYFEKPNKEWFNYIIEKRRIVEMPVDYDVVIGPIPNKKIYEKLAKSHIGFTDRKEIDETNFSKPPLTQVAIKNDKAERYIEYLGGLDSESDVPADYGFDILNRKVVDIVNILLTTADVDSMELTNMVFKSDLYKSLKYKENDLWAESPVELVRMLNKEIYTKGCK